MLFKRPKGLFVILTLGLILLVTGKSAINSSNINSISYIEVTKFQYMNSQSSIIKTWKFEERNNIRNIFNALNDREKIYAKIDIRARDYKVLFAYKDGKTEEFSLWISDTTEARGILMKENKAWYLKSNAILKDILK